MPTATQLRGQQLGHQTGEERDEQRADPPLNLGSAPLTMNRGQVQAQGQMRKHRVSLPHVQHRIGAVMAHVPWYAFKSQARLAADIGFSKSAVSRLLHGECTPSLDLACALTDTLEKRLGRKLEPRELFSLDGTYPTPSACQLVGCANCLPPEAYDRDDNLRPEFKDVPAGQWSVSPPRQDAGATAPSLKAKTEEAR